MNEDREKIVKLLEGSFLGESLSQLSRLYDQVEEETDAFCAENGVHCAFGCGTCCEHFMPDITPIEARLVAAYLLLVSKDYGLIERTCEHTLDHCPLYKPDSPYHCQVYPVRPLICRLFAQCASRAKNGDAVFHRCKYNKEGTMPKALVFPPSSGVRTMDEFGTRLRALTSGEEDEVRDLDEAVEDALGIVRMVASYMGNSDHDDSNPSPKAS